MNPTVSRARPHRRMHGVLLLACLTLGAGALAQPKEEPVPEGVLGIPDVRIFVNSPLWFAWKLPGSKFVLAYAQGPKKTDASPMRHLLVLDKKGKLDQKQTEALTAALVQADPGGKCLTIREDRMPLLMPMGSKALVLTSSLEPDRSCRFTWNARRKAIEVEGADSVQQLCGLSGCSPKDCWLTDECWLPEGPDLDAVRKGFHPSPLAQSLREGTPAPAEALLAATLPGSGRLLIWVPSWRPEDPADPDKKTDSRIFLYDPKKKTVDLALTRKLTTALQSPLDECQGLGTVAELQQRDKAVAIRQIYAPATMNLSCSSKVTWNAKARKFDAVAEVSGVSGGLGAAARGEEGSTDENTQALELWKSNKPQLALAIWERLYSQANYQSPSFGEVCSNLGMAYMKLREFQKAEEVLLDCEKSFPQRAELQLYLGDLYRDTKRAQEALPHYQHFLEMEGGTPAQRQAAEKSLKRLKGRK